MKAKMWRASRYNDKYWVEIVNTLEDLISLIDKYGDRLVVGKNDSYHSKPYPHKQLWEEEKKQGLHECELEIIVYDDYLE